jgi:putative ABC transport system permease protein
VSAAAFPSYLPLSDAPPWAGLYGAQFENEAPEHRREIHRYAISPGYLQAMQIPLKRGRVLDERDSANAPHVAVISESLALSQFHGRDGIGERLLLGPPNNPWYTVVGIVGNVRQTSLALSEPDAVYITPAQSWFADESLSLLVRTRGDTPALASAVREAIWSVDRDQAIVRIVAMSRLREISVAQRRFVSILFETFGLAALLLAATGIYGILSSTVAERTREIGVRAALGATRRQILGLVLRQGMTMTALGLVTGLGGALLSSRVVASLLYGVSRLDPITYTAVSALLVLTAAIACLVPACRAANIDPVQALRNQ